ncbi:TPA: conjugal transfer protein TraF [Vibrio parahaemolyticus]|uniref:conjugal transfer protein TraF n=1 Tax=Vibrio campbellii TaxID=680 RepID=UPI001F077233|nr:conjugal transfer protein TraF [Vibrio campbellii]UMM06577.1 conjugal transfer protein TraF [Vibrio campbellii]
MKTKILSAAIAACLMAAFTPSTSAADQADGGRSSFYDRKSEGWFWYEPEPEPVEEVEEEKKPLPPAESVETKSQEVKKPNEVVVNVAWLRENLPKLRDAAIDDPTYDNVRRYFYAQRVMMDKASKFASVSQEVSKFEVALDETLRRPDHQTALYDFKLGAKNSRNAVIQELSKQVGFFFFYSSNCSYCMKQAPLLKRMSSDTGIDVLAVSLDGRPLPSGEYPDYVTDPGTLRERLQVMVTPTIYLVKKDGSEFHNVAAGLTSPDELMRRTVMLAKRQGWITEEQYNSTKEVKEILLADDTKEKLVVDEEKVFSDPNYLADKLRQKFQSQYRAVPAAPNNEGTQP